MREEKYDLSYFATQVRADYLKEAFVQCCRQAVALIKQADGLACLADTPKQFFEAGQALKDAQRALNAARNICWDLESAKLINDAEESKD